MTIDDNLLGLAGQNNSVVLGLEPLHGVLLGKTMRVPNFSNLAASGLNIHAGAPKDNIEVHAVDTDAGVIPRKEQCEKEPIYKFDYVSWPLNITTIFSGNGLVLLGFYTRIFWHHCKMKSLCIQ